MPLTNIAIPQRVVDRIFDRVDVRAADECWPWLGCVGNHGYGATSWGATTAGERPSGTTAHRVAWIAKNGPIPDGLTVDHICRNRVCCNPVHLRLLSNVANASDNGMATRTHCPADHPYDETNTHIDRKGHRRCRECNYQRGVALRSAAAS